MSDSLFPSGPWVGFYNYQAGGKRHEMDLNLTFEKGNVRGSGSDDVGLFHIRGRYDTNTRECHWTKSYVGAHDVFYTGFREGKGIWGTWEILAHFRGGFRIWPLSEGGIGAAEESSEQEPRMDAVSTREIAQPATDPSRF